MNEKIKISSGADLIALVMHSVGFKPTESLVLIAMAGKRIRATLRIDLPPNEAGNETLAVLATSTMLGDVEADGSLFFIFTEETGIDGQPSEALVETLIRELDKGGIPARDGWLINPEGWGSYLELDVTMHPMTEVTDSVLSAELTFRGSSYAATNAAAIPEFVGDATAPAARIAALVTMDEVDPFDTEAEPMATARNAWQSALDSQGGGGDNTALIAFLQNVMVRDRLMVDVVSVATSVEDFSNALMGQFTSVPNWRRVDAAEATLARLLTETPGTYRAPLLTITGWLEWLKGRGTNAGHYFAAALQADRGYRLAQLLDQLVGAGYIAAVAQNKATAYTPE